MADTIAFDTVLDLCRDQHRRIVLAVLAEEHRSLTLNDLTKSILKYNYRAPMTEVSREVTTRIRCSLHHVYLPKLASAGVVEYDLERHLVEPTEQFDQLQLILSTILEEDPSLEATVEF